MTAGIAVMLDLIDVQQLKLAFAFDLGSGSRNNFERNPNKIEGQLIPGYSFFFGARVGPDQRGVTFEPGKTRFPHEHAAQLVLVLDEVQEAEFGALFVLLQQDQSWIQAEEIASVPVAMVVSLVRKSAFVPARITIVDQQVEFEVDMRAVFRDSLASIGGAAHHRQFFSSVYVLPGFEVRSNLAQVGV